MTGRAVNWNECIDVAAVTDIGMRRSNNQDSYAVSMAADATGWYQRGHLFIVADGMGAHAAGELASKLAVDNIAHLYHKHADMSAPEALQKAVVETNSEVNRRGEANAEFHAMGTTVSTLVLLPQGAIVAHVGDSRVYRFREDKLEQLTFDHSLVWELQASGQLEGNVDTSAIPKNVITRSLGPNPTVKVDLEGPFPVQSNDTFLLCSDGLTGKVEDDEIANILAHLPSQEAAQLLTDLANLRGGPDNITVIVAKVTGTQLTTAASRAEPLRVGTQKGGKRAPVPVGMWIAVGVCFLAAACMALVAPPVVALGAVIAGVICLTYCIIRVFGGNESPGTMISGQRRLGKGPHTNTPCPDTGHIVDKLAGVVQRLQAAAQKEGWRFDAEHLTTLIQNAQQSAKANKPNAALKEYAAAINQMMSALRAHKKESNDSVLD